MMSKVDSASDIFECRMCGDCCNGFGGTYVTREDIITISAYLCCDPETFMDHYCDPSGSRHVITQGKDDACIFFDPVTQCTIHPVKPYMCRAWPFIRTLVDHPENWNAMAGSCAGMKKDIPFKKIQEIVTREKEKQDRSSHA